MKTLNCEYVREIYPDVLNGKTDANTATSVRAHLAACPECRVEADLIEALFASRVEVPAGLHERVMGVVAAGPAPRRIAPRHLAMAATLAAALIGGSVLLNSQRSVGPAGPARVESGLGVVTVEAAMVSGTGSLKDLSVEELEQLLGEIES